MNKCPVTHLTMNNGAPVVDNQNSMTAGPRGPLLAQDLWLNEKLANFVREVIPERRMHAKGSGALIRSKPLTTSTGLAVVVEAMPTLNISDGKLSPPLFKAHTLKLTT